jgi:hypothetical protein
MFAGLIRLDRRDFEGSLGIYDGILRLSQDHRRIGESDPIGIAAEFSAEGGAPFEAAQYLPSI